MTTITITANGVEHPVVLPRKSPEARARMRARRATRHGFMQATPARRRPRS